MNNRILLQLLLMCSHIIINIKHCHLVTEHLSMTLCKVKLEVKMKVKVKVSIQ